MTLPEEQELIKSLLDYPSLVAGAAEALEPHRVANYLQDTAGQVHLWYHKAHVLNEPEPIMRARLALARASQLVLRNGLDLLGSLRPRECELVEKCVIPSEARDLAIGRRKYLARGSKPCATSLDPSSLRSSG